MFTGLIEEVGTVIEVSRKAQNRITVATQLAQSMQPGDSLAVNGCCLTLSSLRGDVLGFDLLDETIARTNLKDLRRGDSVNLERALAVNQRLGGHFVQGHIDFASPILAFEKCGADFRLEIELPEKFAHYIASKGSIAVNGISLTVAEVLAKSFATWIVPYTKDHTNLNRVKMGDSVNVEFDILAKYVGRMLRLGGELK